MVEKSKSSPKAKNSAKAADKVVKEEIRPEKVKQKLDPPKATAKTLQDILEEAGPQKMEALTRNMSDAIFESQQILRDVTTANLKKSLDPNRPDPFGAGQALSKVGENLARHPDRLFAAQMELWEGHLNIWRSMLTGKEETKSRDKRFSDPEWSSNPMFNVIQQTYELNSNWLMNLIGSAEELDETTRRKANFFAKQTADAFCPTNFFSTNPAALKAMLETGGESVLEGLKLARADLQRGHGRLMISQTDGSEFKLGENIATAPGKVVYQNDLIEIIQYDPSTKKVYEIPLLIFPPWINKFYILDLRKENSMIRWLTKKGISVFVVAWRSADHSMAHLRWDDYVSQGAYAATEAVTELTGCEKINTVGYCIGGTMLTSALARMAQEGDERIQSATYFASQADFAEAGDLKVFTDSQAIRQIEHCIHENGGVMAGEDMAETFNYLRPADLVWRYVVDSYMMGKKPRPFDLLYWNSDQTNIPGPTHLTYLKDLYCDNAMAKGEFRVLGRKINIGDIKIPIMVQASREDHIAPFKSVYNTARAFGGPTELVLAGSGHIAGVVNHPDAKKYQHWVNPDLPETHEEWLSGAEEHEGSWWPHWFEWLKARSGEKIPARETPDFGLGDAPGNYVKLRLEDLGVGDIAET
tara:strand:+ start:7488 stop:9413 length:1926 start_codon:yes stop_codon:yes gene_type:complete